MAFLFLFSFPFLINSWYPCLGSSDFTPSLDFELTRRQVEKGVQELWWYMSDQLHQLKKKMESYSEVTAQIDQVLEEGEDHVRYAFFKL